ncbi:leucine-rich repeat-containing protein 27-like isoform X1 [Biomphalaria glabrata]|uniref:Leucine-rich repeat-containing protein 27-like isoform X1 n=1 Tax=Biomphalaria glabrata TaxID=6526 RepID=A0A9U8DVV7_BIOGL|nr:leucine-rich repeat-containing protein 27-like isoform X1 [Biomphalaria glabrata]KAI8769733.1 leucine-rich repeat-containing protein 27-like isoform X1 [Biomphalaria glabrata]
MDVHDIDIFKRSHLHSEGNDFSRITEATPNINPKDVLKETDTEEVLFTSTNQSLSETEHNDVDAASDTMFAKTISEQQNIMSVIDNVKKSKALSADLSRKHLQAIPEALLGLQHLEYLYLEGNQICYLPDDFFSFFPHLVWLDLRNNLLSRIPSLYLSSHTCLRNLLLEGNTLRNLPLELGLVSSLHGLNIAGNPLEFPPQTVIETGTQGILKFLRDVLAAKNSSKLADTDLTLSKDDPECLDHSSDTSDDWNTSASMMELAKLRDRMNLTESGNLQETELDKHHLKPSEVNIKKTNIKKVRKFGDYLVIGELKKKKESKMSWKVNHFPAPPTQDYVRFKMKEEKQVARVKEFKEKTEAILQRRKDDEILKNWRDEAKVLQRKKYLQHLIPGKDYKEPAEYAPFDVDKEMMQVLSKEKYQQEELQREQKLKQERSISPATRQKIQQEKQARIHELEKKIKTHMTDMMERRKQPKGSAQQEMEIAKRELEVIKRLQHDLKDSYQKLKAWN